MYNYSTISLRMQCPAVRTYFSLIIEPPHWIFGSSNLFHKIEGTWVKDGLYLSFTAQGNWFFFDRNPFTMYLSECLCPKYLSSSSSVSNDKLCIVRLYWIFLKEIGKLQTKHTFDQLELKICPDFLIILKKVFPQFSMSFILLLIHWMNGWIFV